MKNGMFTKDSASFIKSTTSLKRYIPKLANLNFLQRKILGRRTLRLWRTAAVYFRHISAWWSTMSWTMISHKTPQSARIASYSDYLSSVIKLQRKQTPRKSRKRLLLPLCPPVQGTSQVCRSLSMRGYDHMTSCDWLLHTLHVYGCRVSRIVKPGNVKDTQKYVWSHICCYLLFYFLYKLLKKVDVISYCIFNQNRKKCVFHLWKNVLFAFFTVILWNI